MTRIEIFQMEAGREMDALVAEKVMGWIEKKYPMGRALYWTDSDGHSQRACIEAWNPSTNISAAWEVIEKIEGGQREMLCNLIHKGFGFTSLIWEAELRECRGNHKYYIADATTAPLAICRAALLAVMEKG